MKKLLRFRIVAEIGTEEEGRIRAVEETVPQYEYYPFENALCLMAQQIEAALAALPENQEKPHA